MSRDEGETGTGEAAEAGVEGVGGPEKLSLIIKETMEIADHAEWEPRHRHLVAREIFEEMRECGLIDACDKTKLLVEFNRRMGAADRRSASSD